MDFLWHKVAKEEQEKIKEEARQILEKFSKAIEKVENEVKDAKGVQREIQTRKETKANSDKEFRKLFFKNAESKEGDFIIAEKGSWK